MSKFFPAARVLGISVRKAAVSPKMTKANGFCITSTRFWWRELINRQRAEKFHALPVTTAAVAAIRGSVVGAIGIEPSTLPCVKGAAVNPVDLESLVFSGASAGSALRRMGEI